MKFPLLIPVGFLVLIFLFWGGMRNPAQDAARWWGDIDESLLDPTKINTIGWEDSPYITPDDQQFYFFYTPWNFFPMFLEKGALPVRVGPDRPGHHTNPNGWGDGDIYVATKKPDGSWSIPVNLGFNDGQADCCMMLTADGKAIYFQKGRPPSKQGKADLYVVRKKADGSWGRPQWLGPSVNTQWVESNPHISQDEKTLYFESDRPGGQGKSDLYYSKRKKDGAWGQAVPMGPKINSPAAETQIWVDDAENVIYFTRGGAGYVHRSKRIQGGWSKPVPILFGTKRPIGEISFSNRGQKAYFAIVDYERKDLVMVYSQLQPDGAWSQPKPLD